MCDPEGPLLVPSQPNKHRPPLRGLVLFHTIYHCVCVCVCVRACARVLCHFSCVLLFAVPWTVAHQARLSMGFSRQEYWTGFPCPPPGDLPNPGIT